jgi:hypothetical protein
MKTRVLSLVVLGAVISFAPLTAAQKAEIQLNDNVRPAGQLQGNTLTLHLYAGTGAWRPNEAKGSPIEIAAFGEDGV